MVKSQDIALIENEHANRVVTGTPKLLLLKQQKQKQTNKKTSLTY
jgi:hypothetical protein